MKRPDPTDTSIAVRVYAPFQRVAIGALLLLAGAALLATFVLLAAATDPPLGPRMEAELLGFFVALPYAVARALQWFHTARMQVAADTITMVKRTLRIEIPVPSVDRIEPWRIPVPGAGFRIILRSGKPLSYALHPRSAADFLLRMAPSNAVLPTDHPGVIHAIARQRADAWRWYHYVIKFVLFPLVPALIFFRAHQYISFGDPFGQYYLYGLASYSRTLGMYAGTLFMHAILWAGVLRAIGEAIALAGTRVAPGAIRGTRRVIEFACTLSYYGGAALVVALVFAR